ncbi:MAG TPA: M20/M25/M40 family metallo-hydrolase [Pyrinomonadaceae bacterium]|nr:M20/M25/M40 family metallo-hydrolase [Pyrinomonadaceae bacterium]
MLRKLFYSTVILASAFSLGLAQTATADVDRLREHVTYLASEKLEGRRTGTKGVEAAAKYIAGEYERLGLRAPAANGSKSYLQPFPFVAGVTLGRGNSLSMGASELRVGEDWMPLGFSLNSRVGNLPAVFVSYGISASDLSYDDYARISATGKVAIAFAATPDEDNPHSRFARYKDPRWRAVAARNAGAKALLLIVRAANFNEAHLSRLHFDNSAGDAGIPVIAISRQAALKLLNLPNDAALARLESSIKHNAVSSVPAAAADVHKINPASAVTLSTNVVRQQAPGHNVIGVLEGSDPSLKHETIVIGAHYDHLGRGGEGSLAPEPGEVHHGADDNASGTAAVLELARIFAAHRPRRTIVFAAFSGEEEGLLGSNYYVNNPPVPLANTIAMINMDMIGRMKENKLVIGGVGTASEWRSIIETANLMQSITVSATGAPTSARNFPMVVASNGRAIVTSDSSKQFVITMNEDGFGPSDHSSFYAKQIPVLFFWTGTHEDYHKPSDTADKINYTDHARIVSVVSKIVRELDASDKRPTYSATRSPAGAGRSTGFRVYLGTIPNYSDSTDGLLLDGVREESPAAKAGLRAGDRIMKLAGRDIRNVYDYTAALGEMKADNEYEVEVLRGTERLTLKLTPAARK